jgi:hypothetical protein
MSREQQKIGEEGGGPAADASEGTEGEDTGSGDPGAGGEGGDDAAGGEPGSSSPRDLGPDAVAARTVEGCNDSDRVLRQLCEAATQEKDPFLRSSLWDEYNEYKRVVAR